MEGNVLSLDDKRQEIKHNKEQERKVIEDCQALYDWAVEDGMGCGDAYEFVKEQKKEIEEYWSLYYWDSMGGNVQKSIEVGLLKEYGDWDNLTKAAKSKLLFDLGVDTWKYKTMVMKRLVNVKGKQKLREVVVGMERLDKDWVNARHDDGTPHASYEAREQSNIHRYGCSIRELCNNNRHLCVGEGLKGKEAP